MIRSTGRRRPSEQACWRVYLTVTGDCDAATLLRSSMVRAPCTSYMRGCGMNDMSTMNDLQGAERAFGRVQAGDRGACARRARADERGRDQRHLDALGVAERIVTFRERMARLPEFDVRHVDGLTDYALAAWYAYVTHLPAPDPEDLTELLDETTALRAKLLMWAQPLVGSGKLEQAALDKIREGSGHKVEPR